MSTIGPNLPSHLQPKRKREEIGQDEDEMNSETLPGSVIRDRKKRIIGPTAPLATAPDDLPNIERKNSDARTVGPTAPPAPIGESPAVGDVKELDSDSDDDYGPALVSNPVRDSPVQAEALTPTSPSEDSLKKPQREEWMLAPPPRGDWTAHADPTKLKNRRFNTGKGARAPIQAPADGTLWTETPEQKRKRLQNEVLGVVESVSEKSAKQPSKSGTEDRETRRRIEEYREKNRGESLYQQHQKNNHDKEDDPSKRAFDRDKDMGGGAISGTKRKEFWDKVADYGSRFSKGNYL